MREVLTELLQTLAAWLQGEGPLTGLLSAWWDLHVRHHTDADHPIPYRVIQ